MLSMFLKLLPILIVSCNGARILGIVPTASYSHQVFYQPIWKELSLRGHQVTVLTTDPVGDPSLTNLTEIDLSFSYKLWNKKIANVVKSNDQGELEHLNAIASALSSVIEQQLKHPKVQDLIQNETEHFDLVMVEFLMPTMLAFAERFKCPFIGLTSVDAPTYVYEILGNPTHPTLYSANILQFGETQTIKEKIFSTLLYAHTKLVAVPKVFEKQQIIIEKYFGQHYPPLLEIAKNMSMLFVNSDPIFHPIRPLLPTIVQIGGGSHRQSVKPLPKDLKTILDDSQNGFIYFSLGSNVKSKDLSHEKRNLLLEVFSELPYTVLWKFELENLPGKPKNVFISKWWPQQDILKHPHIKLFITQGGIQSMDEAIYDYVPMVGIPFFADQPSNVKKMVAKGFGLAVDHHTMNKNILRRTILEVIENPKYRNAIKRLANLATDQPMTGLERAVWWTEYVLRHNGAEHLRNPLHSMSWYQYFLVDVVVVLLIVLCLILCLLYFLFKFVYISMNYVLKYVKILNKIKEN